MNEYVKQYKIQRINGFKPIEAFGIIAAGIAVGGTIEDLRIVEKAYWNDLVENTEGFNHERITSAV